MQKALNIVNVCVQAMLILILVLLLLSSWDSSRKFLNTDNFIMILVIEILLGLYQTIHALVVSIQQMYKQKISPQLKIYWLILILFFLFVIIVLIFNPRGELN